MADAIDFAFHCGSFAEGEFSVLRFEGSEGISQLYRFDIELVSASLDIDVDDLQDQSSELVLRAGTRERRIQGIVSEVEVLDQAADYTIYRVVLVPRVWELTLGTASAVHLDRTTPEILHGALEQQLGITSVDYGNDLRGDYRKWPFRLQYNESHWDFLSRLMERDGVYYYFTAGDEIERIVFCDAADNQPRLDNPVFRYNPVLGMDTIGAEDEDTVDALVMRQRRVPRTVWVQNYNDDKPSTPIRESAEVDPRGTGTVNLYGQTVLDPAEARAIAAIRAEELGCRKTVHHGESTSFRLAAAHCFEVTGHRRAANNREYQVLTVEHSGYSPVLASEIGRRAADDTPVYENRFTAIPAERQFRAPRTTEWPHVRGTINAVVDAEADGQYAELDEEGRYHIVFPFHEGFHSAARGDAGKASHWVRLVQPFSGEREGMHFPLRKGTRVLVGFIGGNPDLPVITGTIPTAEQRSVVNWENQTRGLIRTPGGNEIETDDMEGGQRVRLHSRSKRSTLYLGADQRDLDNARSAGAAASGNTDADDDQADGVHIETDGMWRVATFSGTHVMQAAAGWGVTGTLWPDTPTQRDAEFAAATGEIGSLSGFDTAENATWTISQGGSRVFAFPVKHSPDLDQDESARLSASEEARGDFLVTRSIGDEYSFRSGTTFAFTGRDREVFEFGPRAHYIATSHDFPANGVDGNDPRPGLRKLVRDTVPEFAQFSQDPEHYRELAALRAELDAIGAELAERQIAAQAMDSAATAQADENEDVTPPGRSRLFASEHDFQRWAELHNYDHGADAGWESVTVQPAAHGPGPPPPGDTYYAAEPEEMQAHDPPAAGSVADRQRAYEAKETEYQEKRADHPEAAGRGWVLGMRDARMTVKHGDEFRWHTGNVYDFGGFWDYNLGNGYTENHIHQQAELNATDLDEDRLGGGGGPNWTTIDIDQALKDKEELPGGDPDIGDRWTMGTMLVEKTVGDTYDYHNGAEVSVHVGPSHEVRKGGPRVEENITGAGVRTEYTLNRDGWVKTWRNHRFHGTPLAYEESSWGSADAPSGKNEFSAEFAASLSMAMKMSSSLSTALNLAAATDISVTGGVALEVGVYGGLKTSVGVFGGINASIEVSTGSFEMKNGNIETNVPGLKLYNNTTSVEQKMMHVANATLRMSRSNLDLGQAELKLDNALLNLLG